MISQSEATTALTSALKGFKLEASEASEIVDKLTAVDSEAAVSAGGIATALSKSSVSAKLAGMSMDELIASVSVIGETTQKSMDSVGEAMKTLLARYGNVKTNVFTSLSDTSEETEGINDIEKTLSKLGVRIRSSASEMRSITDVLDELAAKWDTLDTVTKNAVATAFGGTRQRENFLVLMENYERMQELVKTSADSSGTSDKKYESYLDSVEAALKRVTAAWEDFTQKLKASGIVKLAANAIALFTENLDKFAPMIASIAATIGVNKFTQNGGFKGLFGGEGRQTFMSLLGFGGTNADSYLGKTTTNIRDDVAAIKNKMLADDDGNDSSDSDNSPSGKSTKSNKVAANIISGLSAGLMAGMATNTVGGMEVFGTQIGPKSQIEANVGDQIWKGGVTAATTIGLSFIPAVGPILSKTLGPILGSFLGDLTLTWFHHDELEMKERSEEAQEQLEALNNIQSTLDDGNDIMTRSAYSTDDWKELIQYTDDLRTQYEEYIAAGGTSEEFFKDFNADNINNIQDLIEQILNTSTDDRAKIQDKLNLLTAKLVYDETIEKQESDRNTNVKDAMKALRDAGSLLKGDFLSVADIASKIEWLYKGNVNYNNYMSAIEPYLTKEQAWDKDVRSAAIEKGFLSTSLSNYTTSQLSDLTLNGAIMLIAQQIGDEAFDSIGKIKDEYKTEIKSYIKSELPAFASSNTKTIGKLVGSTKKLDDVLQGSSYTYDSLAKMLKYNTSDNQNAFRQAAKQLTGGSVETLMGLVYGADPDLLSSFASAWNTTVEGAKELANKFPELTTAIGLMTASEVREHFSSLGEILESMADSTKLTAENFENIISNYPRLIKYLGKGKEGELSDEMLGIIDEEQRVAYANALFSDIMGSENWKDEFQSMYEDRLSNDMLEQVKNAKSLDEVLQIAKTQKGMEGLETLLSEFLDKEYEIEWVDQSTTWAIEYKTELLERQIDALEAQKDALKDNNDERQREIDLIKAREALENAKKDKKRVYRSGVGWVYEADESAIQSAQEALDELDIEYQQNILQTQIDSLSTEKDILNNLEDNKQLESLSNKVGDISEFTSKLVTQFTDGSLAINFADAFIAKSASLTSGEAAGNIINSLKTDAETAYTNYQNEQGTWQDYETAYDKYNEQYDEFAKTYGEEFIGEKISRKDINTDSSTDTSFVFEDGKFYYKYNNNNKMQLTPTNISPSNSIYDDVKKIINAGEFGYYKNNPYYVSDDGSVMLLQYISYGKPDGSGFATGTTGLTSSGFAMINEVGTEGLITPSGTLTALPSKTGIVPADITKNVWQLGEVAPTLIAKLNSLESGKYSSAIPQSVVNEEGQYIDHLTMNVYPTKDYDMDALLAEARAKVRLTRHNN